jgi:endoglucanase
LGESYYWGCNGTVARQTIILYYADMLSPREDYIDASLDAIGHLLGRNYYGRSYVTGVGHNPPMHPHDRRSSGDMVEAPWPGYLVGGGHSAMGWHDEETDYRTNEIAINWNAALIFAVARYVEK